MILLVCFARFNDYISPLLPYSFHHVVCLSLSAQAYHPILQFTWDNIQCILGKHPVQASSNLTIHHLCSKIQQHLSLFAYKFGSPVLNRRGCATLCTNVKSFGNTRRKFRYVAFDCTTSLHKKGNVGTT